MGQKDEFKLHKNIAEYIRLRYPDAVFLSTLNGIKLPIGQAVQAASLQSGRALPDLILLQARRLRLDRLARERAEIVAANGARDGR